MKTVEVSVEDLEPGARVLCQDDQVREVGMVDFSDYDDGSCSDIEHCGEPITYYDVLFTDGTQLLGKHPLIQLDVVVTE